MPPAHTFFEKRSILENLLFLTLAMIHPTRLHLCTKLFFKDTKGDAIHPTCLHLCTKLFFKDTKGDAIHPTCLHLCTKLLSKTKKVMRFTLLVCTYVRSFFSKTQKGDAIHPICLHLCTKLLSKTQKGDAIHPEKSVLFYNILIIRV